MSDNFIYFRTVNTVALVILLLVQALGGSNLFGGKSIGELSDYYDTFLTPAGYAFAIWGLIFSLEAAFVVYMYLPYGDEKLKAQVTEKLGYLMSLGWMAQNGWLLTFTHELMWLAFFFILTAFVCFLIAQFRLYGRFSLADLGLGEWLLFTGISINAAWLSAASNISILIMEIVVTNNSSVGFAVVLATIGVVFGSFVSVHQANPAYALVLVWALNGVRVAQSNSTIVFAASLGAVISAVAAVGALVTLGSRMKKPAA